MPLFKFLRMDRLRRSLRDSFRKKKDHVPECSKPHQWQADEAGVRAGTCNFSVKYLGCVEVFESRGMQVCEEALKMLRNSRRRAIKGILYVTGDGLRVVDDETKGLIVDQTIEKVSFCAPDRNHEKGFSYICRDGTTRRWMCHGFLAVKDSGERLSHAVGCAFAACLERKQKRDKECGVTMTFDHNNSTFTRLGSFRQSTMTERMTTGPPLPSATSATTVAIVSTPGDLSVRSSPLSSRPSLQMQTDVSLSSTTSIPSLPPPPPASAAAPSTSSASTFIPGPPGSKPQPNPYAVERPHATPFMLQRQGSFRGFSQLNQTSPFKRQLSLRLNDLPSNLERQQRSMSLESGELESPVSPASPELSPRLPRNRLQSLPNTVNMSPIPESSPVVERPQADSISAMCQQVARGLSLLSSSDDPFSPTFGSPPGSAPAALPTQQFVSRNGVEPIRETNPWVSSVGNSGSGGVMSRGELWLATNVPNASEVIPSPIVKSVAQSQVTKSASNPLDLFGSQFNGNGVAVAAAAASTSAALPLRLHSQPITALAPPRKAPHIAHLRSQSLGAAVENSRPSAPNSNQTVPNATTQQQISSSTNWATFNGSSSTSVTTTCTTTSSVRSPNFRDPFDADWATVATSKPLPSTNPFAQGSVKTFEVHM